MKAVYVLCGLLLLAGAPAALGARELSAVYGTGVLPQPGLDSLGSINTLSSNPVVTPAASPVAAPAAAPAQAPAAAVPADVAVVAPAPAKAAAAGATFGAFAPAPGPAAARKRRVALRNSVFILDADYATLTIPDPDSPEDGTLELSGFSRHVSYFTDARGTGVRRSGRIPITNFANTTFPDARNATANATGNASAGGAPNAALYASDDSYYAASSDRLLRVLTLRGRPAVAPDNSTLTFNVTVAPSFAGDDVVTVYRVSFNQTANATDGGAVAPQVTEAQYGTTTTYESVALYVGNWWWGQETDAASVRRHEERREQRRQEAWSNWYWP